MLCKLQYDRINNNTKIMCFKKDYTFFWRLVYIDGNSIDVMRYIQFYHLLNRRFLSIIQPFILTFVLGKNCWLHV